jgi:hypothetical protein
LRICIRRNRVNKVVQKSNQVIRSTETIHFKKG